MKFLDNNANDFLKKLPDNVDKLCHAFDPEDIKAINAALATGRPLLVRGDPGVGKTQMAKAAACVLKRALLTLVVDSRTESRDLLWHFDAVERLADAQILGNIEKDREIVKQELSMAHYIKPGPFWWALDWNDAKFKNSNQNPDGYDEQTSQFGNGCIVLINEIDKAESDVPNGLLEVLAENQFSAPLGGGFRVKLTDQKPPLVLITTNEERDLPAAFIRRCLVRHIKLPEDETKLKDKLIERGKIHFSDKLPEKVYQKAAELILSERDFCKTKALRPLPGQAEYLDLLKAAFNLKNNHLDACTAMEQVAEYVIKKHTEDNDEHSPHRLR